MEHTYKIIEIAGSSPTSIEDAVNNGIERASRTVREMRWFEISEIRGHLADQKVDHWQIRMKVGFTLEEPSGS